nr:hypothetical protein [uncultured Dubosiella sp.]
MLTLCGVVCLIASIALQITLFILKANGVAGISLGYFLYSVLLFALAVYLWILGARERHWKEERDC